MRTLLVAVCIVVNVSWIVLYLYGLVRDGIRHVDRNNREEFQRSFRPLVVAALDDRSLHPIVANLKRSSGRIAEEELLRYTQLVRGEARENALLLLQARGVIPDAMRGLDSMLSSRKVRSAERLGLCQHGPAMEPLLDLLNDRSVAVRSSAANALGRIADRRAITALAATLQTNRKVNRNTILLALQRMGKAAIPQALMLAQSQSRDASVVGLELLGLGGDDRYLGVIEALMASSDPAVATAACNGVHRIASPRSVVPLAEYLAFGAHRSARATVARALGRIASSDKAANLQIALDPNEPTVNMAIVEGLRSMGGKALHSLRTIRDHGGTASSLAGNAIYLHQHNVRLPVLTGAYYG